ncbi:unnamed protein product [Coregonus sp. 'balchen']|nr:unnamed protein product [Coregonus sp. 'balchen']
MRVELSCGCPSLGLSRGTACFYLLGALIVRYMLAGAAVFSAFERPAELKANHHWDQKIEEFGLEHGVNPEDLSTLLLHYEEANTVGVRMVRHWPHWVFPGAFYFAGTVVSTIGESRGWIWMDHVCCTYILFNALSVIIKQRLNWILSQLIHLRSCLCHGRPLRCPLFPMFLLNLVDKCLCADATVETLCHRNMDLSTTKAGKMGPHGHSLPGGDVKHVGPP